MKRGKEPSLVGAGANIFEDIKENIARSGCNKQSIIKGADASCVDLSAALLH